MIRKIVQIDENKCNGCGICIPACAEGAIRIVNGKAVLAADNLCDGLGACLGECPEDAIRVIERDADEFDEEAVEKHLQGGRSELSDAAAPQASEPTLHHGGCPGSRAFSFEPSKVTVPAGSVVRQQSELGQWPVQLHLVPVNAPYFQDADLLIAADCVPFAYPDFHRDFLSGRALVVGCPKLDDIRLYRDKLTELFKVSSIKSVTVVRMEVPCCGGIVATAKQALEDSGKSIPFRVVTVGIKGEIRED